MPIPIPVPKSKQVLSEPDPHPPVSIQRGIPAGQEKRAAALFYEAFEAKFQAFASRAQVLAVLPQAFRREQALTALREGDLIGLAGIQHGRRSLFQVKFRPLVRLFGLFPALVRTLVLGLYRRPYRQGELLMDGLCVQAAWRGRGVGTRLLQAVLEFAREQGYRTVRLDVVDTNPGARRLYERQGFTAVRTIRTPFTRRRMGFGAVTTMVHELGPGSTGPQGNRVESPP